MDDDAEETGLVDLCVVAREVRGEVTTGVVWGNDVGVLGVDEAGYDGEKTRVPRDDLECPLLLNRILGPV